MTRFTENPLKLGTMAFSVVNVILLAYAVADGGADEVGSCKAVLANLIKDQLAHVKSCLTEMEFSHGKEKSEKMLCVMVCSLKKAGFLDDDGMTDAASALTYLENQVPPEMRDRAMNVLTSCHEHIGKITTTDDPKCKSYEPLMKCAQGAINKLCD